MIIEVPIDELIRPPVTDAGVVIDEFESEDQLAKNVDFTFEQQSGGFKDGISIAIADKNINISRRPGFLTVDTERREEPHTVHPDYIDEKDDFDIDQDQFE